MNQKYWTEFYKTWDVKTPTSFARFCMEYIQKDKTLIDVGCGTGRDTYYFAKNGITSIGVDQSTKPEESHNAVFYQENFLNFEFARCQVYGRFFLHAIETLEIVQFIDKCKDLVMLEFRNLGDLPVLYGNHRRNLIDGRSVFTTLTDHNFEVLFYQLSQGLAEYKGENPLICRIIAKKKY